MTAGGWRALPYVTLAEHRKALPRPEECRGLRRVLAGAKLEVGQKFMGIRKVGEEAYVASNSE